MSFLAFDRISKKEDKETLFYKTRQIIIHLINRFVHPNIFKTPRYSYYVDWCFKNIYNLKEFVIEDANFINFRL